MQDLQEALQRVEEMAKPTQTAAPWDKDKVGRALLAALPEGIAVDLDQVEVFFIMVARAAEDLREAGEEIARAAAQQSAASISLPNDDDFYERIRASGNIQAETIE